MTTPNEQLQVTVDDSLSIDDLLRQQAQGFSVLRSAHVGNFSAYNLTIAEAGIPILAVDHNVTGVDKNYFPERIATQESDTIIAAAGKLSCRAVTANGQFVDEVHIGGVGQAIPTANLFTNTEYVKTHAAIVHEVVALVQTEAPHYFDRVVTPDGSTSKRADAARLLGSYGVMQLQDDHRAERSAVMLPNIADILANFTIEALRTEQAVQYHLSGPDMVKYIGGLLPDLTALHARLRETASFGSRIPQSLSVRLVPTAQASFATTAQRRPQLDRLLSSYQAAQSELAELAASRRTFFTSERAKDTQAKTALLQAEKRRQAAVESELANCMALQPELFKGPGTPGFITQYDVMTEGGLYVPSVNRQKTMRELAVMTKELNRIAKRMNL